jgi:AraC-like DNA-binding protein
MSVLHKTSVFHFINCVELQKIEQRKQPYYPHSHNAVYEIRLVVSGEERFHCQRSTEGKKVIAGDIVILHPNEIHYGSFIGCNYSQYRLYYVSDEYLSSIGINQPYFEMLVIKDRKLFNHLFDIHQILEDSSCKFKNAIIQCNSPDRFARIRENSRHNIQSARADLCLALRYLATEYSSTTLQLVSPEVNRMKKYLDDYKYSGAETLDEIARGLNISTSKLSHQFKLELNISPYLYIRMLQLEKSKLLLAQGKTVSEVTNLIGFKNLSHFSLRFKHYFGLTPAKYKNCLVNENLL